MTHLQFLLKAWVGGAHRRNSRPCPTFQWNHSMQFNLNSKEPYCSRIGILSENFVFFQLHIHVYSQSKWIQSHHKRLIELPLRVHSSPQQTRLCHTNGKRRYHHRDPQFLPAFLLLALCRHTWIVGSWENCHTTSTMTIQTSLENAREGGTTSASSHLLELEIMQAQTIHPTAPLSPHLWIQQCKLTQCNAMNLNRLAENGAKKKDKVKKVLDNDTQRCILMAGSPMEKPTCPNCQMNSWSVSTWRL